MNEFLHHIATKYPVTDKNSLRDKCFVFPSKRASLYFIDILRKAYPDIPFWVPKVLSIEEFIKENSKGLTQADNLTLLFRLFKTYQKNGGKENFEEFYSWGNTLLKDFDEIDRYLVDANLLYKNLQDVEDIEATFGPSEELVDAIKGFKKIIDTGKEGKLTKNFSTTWLLVGRTYMEFHADLKHAGLGYLGMLYRDVAEKTTSGQYELPYEEVIFGGFNAFSKSELSIIDHLLERGKAKLFFDADKYYLDDDKEEAGHFLRKNRSRWYRHPNVEWVISDGFSKNKQLNIIGVEQNLSQARAASEIIQNQGSDNSAIVMGDEALINPMLYSLPEEIKDVNITMGYPIVGSMLAKLVRSYFKYQEKAKKSKNSKQFISREAYGSLISQPVLAGYVNEDLLRLSNGKSLFLPIEAITEALEKIEAKNKNLLEFLLGIAGSVDQAIANIIEFLSKDYYTKKESDSLSILDQGIRYSILKFLKDLEVQLSNTSFDLSFTILDKLLRESFKQMTTPFSGEPLASLQIMGFLESRSLDFDNVVVLAVNEDTIPASSAAGSYIPFGIRKAFGLPTFLDQNSIYSYHFFRLLQRAKHVSLIYSTQLSVTGAGEKSRFILQLLHNFKREDSPVIITERHWTPAIPPVNVEDQSIEVIKTGTVKTAIDDYFKRLSTDKRLTPTQLIDYISCSLKYYYARILNIREPDEESEKIDARVFGNLLHEVLEESYTPWIGKSVSAEEVKSLIKKLPEVVEHSFADYDVEAGEVAFTKKVIATLAEKILKNDLKDAPINILDLESKTKGLDGKLSLPNGITINIGGLIDRLDSINVEGEVVHRVLDYKTGMAGLSPTTFRNKPLNDEDYIAAHFTKPDFKSGFQLLFYIVALKNLQPNWKLNGGIVGVRSVNTGIDYLHKTKNAIPDHLIALFEKSLQALILEIADPAIPFRQTEDVKRCEYCQFKRICNR